ncbi:MAG: amino acid permease [Actinobacteria bacterium]|nr:MAG: amino acid permease [Actinomycetota bacterium]
MTNSEVEDDQFKRVLGLPQVTASGVAIIIGAGIYVLLGPAAQAAGAQVWMSFVLSSSLCALTAFSYMELSSMFPKAGSESEFARQAFPRWIGATVGWSMAIALLVASATVALGFSRYLREFVNVDSRVSAIAIIMVMSVISMLGMQRAGWVIVGLGLIKVGGLVWVCIVGLPYLGSVDLVSNVAIGGVFNGAALVFFAFIGFDEVITLAEETRSPRKTVPRALLLSLVISTVLYVGVSIIATSVLGVEALSNSTKPLADILLITNGKTASSAMAVVALISTASTVLLALTSASRMLYGTASSGDLPRRFAAVYKRRVPLFSLVVSAGVASLLVLLEDISLLAEATDVIIYAMFIIVNLVVLILRRTKPDLHRPFAVKGHVRGVPVLPILGLLATLSMAIHIDMRAAMLAGLIMVSGTAVHLVSIRR